MSLIYLIHFDRKLAHSQHYLGWTSLSLHQRLKRHKTNGGAKLLAAVRQQGIPYKVVRIWKDASRNDERRMKNQHNLSRFCPICKRMKRESTTAITTCSSPTSTVAAQGSATQSL